MYIDIPILEPSAMAGHNKLEPNWSKPEVLTKYEQFRTFSYFFHKLVNTAKHLCLRLLAKFPRVPEM